MLLRLTALQFSPSRGGVLLGVARCCVTPSSFHPTVPTFPFQTHTATRHPCSNRRRRHFANANISDQNIEQNRMEIKSHLENKGGNYALKLGLNGMIIFSAGI